MAPFGNDSSTRIEANNKVKIKNGTREATIVDIWCYNCIEVTEDGRTRRQYTKEDSNDQDVEIKVRIPIKLRDRVVEPVLRKTMRAYIGPKSAFGKLCQGVLGIEPGTPLIDWLLEGIEKNGSAPLTADEAKKITAKLRKAFVGREVFATTERKDDSEYTNISTITAKPGAESFEEEEEEDDGFDPNEAPPPDNTGDAFEDEIPF